MKQPPKDLNDLHQAQGLDAVQKVIKNARPADEETAIPPEFTDEALALRFVAKYGHKLRYVAVWGKWYIFRDGCWKPDSTVQVFDFARRICRAASAECAARNNDSKNAGIAARIASAQTVYAVEKLARTDRCVAATVAQWDVDPFLLNTPGGVVDLCTGILKPHRPDYYMTKITAVTASGDCPLWLRFLQKITAEDAALQTFLQRMAGYSLTGSTKEHALFFPYGTGGNGKGVFLNSISAIMNNYAAIASMETFTDSKHPQHPTDLAMLRGARLVTAQETEEGRRWAESKIKSLTGGDPITARFMRQDFFTYIPQFKLIIAGNHKPGLRNVDKAIRRRFHLVPFTVTITDVDKDLPEKLRAEWPGILQWMIEGAKAWHESGLAVPNIVTEATEDYLKSEDTIERWINECLEIGSSYTATATELYECFKAWHVKNGEYCGSQKKMMEGIRNKLSGVADDTWQCPATRRVGFKGIRIIAEAQATHRNFYE